MLVTVTLGASGDGAGVAGPEPGVNRCLFAPVAVAALFRTGGRYQVAGAEALGARSELALPTPSTGNLTRGQQCWGNIGSMGAQHGSWNRLWRLGHGDRLGCF